VPTTANLKHKALLVTAYSAGLRVGEVVRLKVSDIDSKRMQIWVTAGKGAKDRYTLLSETALTVLRQYFKTERLQDWFFPGEEPGDHLSERSAQHIFGHVKKRADIKKAPFTPCAIRLRRICWKIMWIFATSMNCWDTAALRRPNGTRT